ncbi:DciA family protein [Oerskovia sp. M15]
MRDRPDEGTEDAEDERPSGLPVGEVVDLTPPAQVAREALNRARPRHARRASGPDSRPPRPGRPSPSSGARPGGRDPQTFGAVVQRLLHERGWVQDVSVGGVVGRWREVVGDQVADHCVPETFEDKVLVVRADSTAWATQVQLLTPRLLERLAQEVGTEWSRRSRSSGLPPELRRGPKTVRGRGPRDTYG